MPGQSPYPRPLGERVLIKVLEEQEGTLHESPSMGLMLLGGMIATQQEEQKPRVRPKPARGIVTAVGPGSIVLHAHGNEETDDGHRAYIPLDIKPGDDVLFYSEPGVPVTVNGEELVLVQEGMVLIVLDSINAPAVQTQE